MRYPARSVRTVPSWLTVGGIQRIATVPGAALAGADTTMLNAPRDALARPSLTPITMLLAVPAAVGVPESSPVRALNAAQLGLFWVKNSSVSLFASRAVGTKRYG